MTKKNYSDEELFCACMNFCKAFTMFLIKEKELENRYFLRSEYINREKSCYKKILIDRLKRLQEIVNSFNIGDYDD